MSAYVTKVSAMDPSARMLRLLSLLQARSNWTGDELAQRLEVTSRTLRRDVTSLRDLGYPVEALSGPAGGYQLAPGGALPPLLFDDDEAMAVALGLRAAAGGTVPGFEDAAVAALAKIEQVLPVRLADQINSVQSATVALRSRSNRESSPVEPGVLVTVAQACRGPERLRFDYVDREGNVTERHVEPYRLVHTSRRWYLVARDRDRDAWRTFRVDRMSNPQRTGMWFTHTDPPDAAALVAEGISVQVYRYHARILLHVPHEQAVEMIGPVVGVLERKGRNRTVLRTGADEIGWIAGYLAGLDCRFEVLEPDELKAAVRALGERLIEYSEPPPGR
jgi:predicted DNA-binding transcriptional regulator YafY